MSAFLVGACVAFVAYLAYLETSPRYGGIWIRPDDNGVRRVNLRSLHAYMKEPLRNRIFWQPCNFDMNWIIIITMGGTIGVLINTAFTIV